MTKEEKEGESYLDELLNTVAPDWEDTSSQPENRIGEVETMAAQNDNVGKKAAKENDIALEDAIAILNDLPDMDNGAVPESENPEEDMDELFSLLADLGVDPNEEESSEEPFSVDTLPEAVTEPEEVQVPEEPVTEDVVSGEPVMEEIMMEEPGLQDFDSEEPEDKEEDSISLSEEPVAEDVASGEPVMEEVMMEEPVTEESIMEEPMMEEPEEKEEDSIPLPEEPVAVDDIFQDALSAVAYTGNDEEGNEQEDIFSLDEMAGFSGEPEGVTTIPAVEPAEPQKRKGKSVFDKLFGNVITDSTADEEERERQREEQAREKKAARKMEKKKQAEASKEEKAQLAQEKKEQKKQKKAEMAALKAEKKEKKKQLKAERDAEAAKEVVGKINPVGATIVIIFFVTIGCMTIFGSRLLERRSALNNAENYFANEDYIRAYDAISSVNLKEDDEKLYNRIRLCSQLQKELNSYENYTSLEMKEEALDSLLKGVRFYDMNQEEAQNLQIQPAFEKLKNDILMTLSQNYGIGESEAREIVAIQDQTAYTQRIQQIAGM